MGFARRGGRHWKQSEILETVISFADLPPDVRALPRGEQVQLMRFLAQELARPNDSICADDSGLLAELIHSGPYEVFTPAPCPDAAFELEKLLKTPGVQIPA